MFKRFVKLNALKQAIISVVIKPREALTNSVRISKSKKLVESRCSRAGNSVRQVVRIAALIGLPIVYNAAAPSSSQIPRPMAEESSLQSVIQNADQLFDENHFQEVVDLLNKYKDQSLPDIQWRKARAIFSVSKAIKDKREREKLVNESFELIKVAVEAEPTNFAIHKWMAIILDAASELQGIKARIVQLNTIKFHMDEAVRLNPNDPTSWHMLGAYEYGLAELSWLQRKLVATIFATPPTGSFETALQHFEKAESIKEGFYSTNWLMIGKCHMSLKSTEKAKEFLDKAANCAVLNEDDKKCKEEAVVLLKKL